LIFLKSGCIGFRMKLNSSGTIVEGIFKIALVAFCNNLLPKSFVDAGDGNLFQSPRIYFSRHATIPI